MKLIAFYGASETGKTRAIEKIVKKLKNVTVVKLAHVKLSFDKHGKDSERLLESGARMVVTLGEKETVLHSPERWSIEKVLSFVNTEYVIFEGNPDFPMPKVYFGGKEKMDELTVAVAGEDFDPENEEELVNIVINLSLPPIPNLDCGLCGATCKDIVKEEIEGKNGYSKCVILRSFLKVKLREKEIPLMPFIQGMIRDSLIGMLKHLKGFEGHGKVEIEFNL